MSAPPGYQGPWVPPAAPRRPGVQWVAVMGGVVAFLGLLISIAAIGMMFEALGSIFDPGAGIRVLNAFYLFLAGGAIFGTGIMLGFIGLALPQRDA